MDWSQLPRQSDNVEISCLGEQGPMTDPVLSRCLDELHELRRRYVGNPPDDETWLRRNNAWTSAMTAFLYMEDVRGPVLNFIGQETNQAERVHGKLNRFSSNWLMRIGRWVHQDSPEPK